MMIFIAGVDFVYLRCGLEPVFAASQHRCSTVTSHSLQFFLAIYKLLWAVISGAKKRIFLLFFLVFLKKIMFFCVFFLIF